MDTQKKKIKFKLLNIAVQSERRCRSQKSNYVITFEKYNA